ncbi:MAG: tRNA (adenosine(37)-N6)-dimethylallyltransferase MiaA [Pseudomonadales bacterium]|nr:tRNA (adenosine(37)-N6)-dimethylallyltransferase MiaA [Pseudomonadales bacterium]
MQTVLVLAGPTGAGKSRLAEWLATELPLEIISCDSAQVYRGLDIGTAKPTASVRAAIPHHLIDIRDPSEAYSAGAFVTDVARLVPQIIARGRLPVIVGGTMLYLRTLVRGIAALPEATPELRQAIDSEAAERGWPALHAALREVDPAAAARIHPHDPQRIQRALEVFRLTGTPISVLQHRTTPTTPYVFSRIAIAPASRTLLHGQIEQRFMAMLGAGLIGEVAGLRARGNLTERHASIRSVGYRQLWAHVAGEYDLDTAVCKAVAATRQLAKRQLTWLRSDPGMTWLDPTDAATKRVLKSRATELLRNDCG